MDTETKANRRKRIGTLPYRNIFLRMKQQKSRQKLRSISVKLHQMCLPLRSPLSPPPHPPTPEAARTTLPLPRPQPTQREDKEDNDFYGEMINFY